MRFREPRSRACEESVDRLAFQAMISGRIQDAKALQKIRAKIGPAENGKGRGCIFLERLPAYDRRPSSWLSILFGGSKRVSDGRRMERRTKVQRLHNGSRQQRPDAAPTATNPRLSANPSDDAQDRSRSSGVEMLRTAGSSLDLTFYGYLTVFRTRAVAMEVVRGMKESEPLAAVRPTIQSRFWSSM